MTRRTQKQKGPHAPIKIQIQGDGLYLGGKFAHWVPMLASNDGADALVQILVDTTSVTREKKAGPPPIFSFTGTARHDKVTDQHKVRGLLRANGLEKRNTRLSVESPHEHTPFIILNLNFKDKDFPKLWQDLMAASPKSNLGSAKGPIPFGTTQFEIRPTAWIRPPTIAAA